MIVGVVTVNLNYIVNFYYVISLLDYLCQRMNEFWLFAAFTVSTDSVLPSPGCRLSSSSAKDLRSPSSSSTFCYLYYNHDEVDRFMAAMHTVENYVNSCTTSGLGISRNQKYISELVGIYLKYATAAVDQLTRNVVQYSVRETEPDFSSFYSETKQVVTNIVEHAATLRECMKQGAPSQVMFMGNGLNNCGAFV